MATPPAAIAMGAAINGVNTDPVTYLLHQIANRYSELEDERTMTMGRAIIDFQRRPNERIDDLLTRWDLARADAASVGADLNNVFLLTTHLIQMVGLSTQEVVQLLQPLNGAMPRNQQQYDALVMRIRQMGHIAERHPDNIANALVRSSRTHLVATQHVFLGENEHPQEAEQPSAGNNPWAYTASTPAAQSIFQANASSAQYYDTAGAVAEESATDTDTASSCGEEYDFSDVAHLTEKEAEQELFWMKEQSNARYESAGTSESTPKEKEKADAASPARASPPS